MSLAIRRTNPTAFQKWMYSVAGFNQLGLYRDDTISYTPDVEKALKRLPKHMVEERNFRITRAMVLDGQKRVLPKEQWTKLEEDVLYLLPILLQIQKEQREKDDWNAQ